MPEDHKEYNLIVNGQPRKWDQDKISYEQVVKLAYPNPPAGPSILFTVQYSRGPDQNPRGTLDPGQSAFVKSGMLFDVVPTNKS